MLILQSHRTQNMILRCYPNVAICYTLETYQILSSVLFQQSLHFPLLIHRIYIFSCILMPSVIKTADTSMLERSKGIYLHVSIYFVEGDMLSNLPSGFQISNTPSTGSSVILLSRLGVLSKVITNMRTRNYPNGHTVCACALDEG